jgi:hypothetical protein
VSCECGFTNKLDISFSLTLKSRVNDVSIEDSNKKQGTQHIDDKIQFAKSAEHDAVVEYDNNEWSHWIHHPPKVLNSAQGLQGSQKVQGIPSKESLFVTQQAQEGKHVDLWGSQPPVLCKLHHH